MRLRELRHSGSAPNQMLVLGNSESQARHGRRWCSTPAAKSAWTKMQLAVDDES